MGYAVYQVVIHAVAFLAVAILSSHLSYRLRQTGQELERRGLDLRNLQTLHQAIVSNISSGLMTLDLEGRVVSFNEAAERITGYTFASLQDRPWQESSLRGLPAHGGILRQPVGAADEPGARDQPAAAGWAPDSRRILLLPPATSRRRGGGTGGDLPGSHRAQAGRGATAPGGPPGGPRTTRGEHCPRGAEPPGGHQRGRGSPPRRPHPDRTESPSCWTSCWARRTG